MLEAETHLPSFKVSLLSSSFLKIEIVLFVERKLIPPLPKSRPPSSQIMQTT